ncbi:sucrase ferredoxin [Luteococcus sp. OSA5]|uniref:sucrase ferredoxin n=1 Tax=Luteococcus sp. OSA5 TaxID=3401630 RepID=UPI003B42DEB0
MITCSNGWDQADIPALGTAPDATFWVALEQPGPWGAKAFTQSRLSPELGAQLETTIAEAGGRLLLIRDPLSHPDLPGQRRILVGGGPVSSPWLGTTLLDDPQALPGLLASWGDLHEHTTPPAPLEACEPALLVCTNGRRDRCCAVKGAPLAHALAERFQGRVWEATHLGGHRFATTTLSLPARQMLAFVDEELAVRALDGKLLPLPPKHDRGRTDLPQPIRSVDAWLRDRIAETDPAALTYRADDAVVHARHRDGRSWALSASKQTSPQVQLPESCGKAAVPASWWQVSEA